MKTFTILILMAATAIGDTKERSFYIGDQRFSIIASGDQLEQMLGLNPRDPKTIELSISDVSDLADEKILKFRKDHNIDELFLQRISMSLFYKFTDGKELWLWEATYSPEQRSSGPVQQISIYFTKSGEFLVPQPRPYSNSKSTQAK